MALLLLALLAQTADAALTCQRLREPARVRGGQLTRYVEQNPFLPQTCSGVVAAKSAALGLTFLLPPRGKSATRVILAVTGGAGVAISLTLKE